MSETQIYYIKRFIKAILLLCFLWCIGFVIYVASIPDHEKNVDFKVDAIVVLTGGSKRIQAGLELFEKVEAKKILISGVGKGVKVTDILDDNGKQIFTKLSANQIRLGELADNTLQNALEAKIFMIVNNFSSMLLVTSNYHFFRTKIIFSEKLPEYQIHYYPVCSHNFRKSNSFISLPSMKLAFKEYNKLIGYLGLRLIDKMAGA